jgi:hypothetical protein
MTASNRAIDKIAFLSLAQKRKFIFLLDSFGGYNSGRVFNCLYKRSEGTWCCCVVMCGLRPHNCLWSVSSILQQHFDVIPEGF